MSEANIKWIVGITNRANKSRSKLSPEEGCNFMTLFAMLKLTGPVQSDWPNYGKLQGKKKERTTAT